MAAREFAGEYGVTLVLKGNTTVTASPDGRAFVNSTGNPGMAKGGSGDILAGIIGSLIGQGLEISEAAACGAYLHGLAGDMAAAELGEYGMLPSDMLNMLSYAIKQSMAR